MILIKQMKWKDAEKFIESNKDIIYLWFGTEWCGDCQMMLPIVEGVAEQYSNNEKISFIKVNAEEAGLFREESKYKVYRVPTHVFIKNSEIRSIMYEYIPEDAIINEIDQLRYEK
ncbi:MAG: thioredoxin family protein [Mycoplasma sp.]|nr:thioredoxin family protein [Mycoplasma sp.]